jgi:hypothetical protein
VPASMFQNTRSRDDLKVAMRAIHTSKRIRIVKSNVGDKYILLSSFVIFHRHGRIFAAIALANARARWWLASRSQNLSDVG